MIRKDKNFQRSLVISGILHLIILVVFLFGLPSVIKKLPEEQNIMTFDIVSIQEINNIKTERPNDKISTEPEQAKQVKKSIKPKEEKPKKDKHKPEIKKEIKPKTPAVTKVKKKIEKVEKVEKETTKPENTTKQPKDSIDSSLKNLEKESTGQDNQAKTMSTSSPKEGKTFSQGDEYSDELPLSATEKIHIREKIRKHWAPPLAAQNYDRIIIMLTIELDKNGVVKKVEKKGQEECPVGAETVCKLTAETAIRAVWKSSPIAGLLPARYDMWKKFTIHLDPSDIGL